MTDSETPLTIDEWRAYISTLQGARLYSVAAAANNLGFVRQLQQEGFLAEDITDILRMFAEQCAAVGLAPPSGLPGEYTSYYDLLKESPFLSGVGMV